MLEAIEAGFDFINALVLPKANAKRLLAAKKKYQDDELVAVELGQQKMLISEPTLNKLIDSGLWGLLEEAAERGTQLDRILKN